MYPAVLLQATGFHNVLVVCGDRGVRVGGRPMPTHVSRTHVWNCSKSDQKRVSTVQGKLRSPWQLRNASFDR